MNAQEKRQYKRQWREANPLIDSAYNKRYRERNRDLLNLRERENYKEKISRQKEIGLYQAKIAIACAVQRGSLPSLSKTVVKCTYCPARAKVYDHRDYNRPLNVDPVCISCNSRLGPAIYLRKAA